MNPFRLFFLALLLFPSLAAADSLDEIREREKAVQAAVDKVFDSVIGIASREGPPLGSGVVVNKDGLILTAGHVTEAAGEKLTIFFNDGREVEAISLGAYYSRDAAMAQITEPGPWPFTDVRWDPVEQGEWVISLGNNGGFQPERPSPVRIGRAHQPMTKAQPVGYIKTDCTLSGGDSGGPLFDLNGNVIGIHSQIGQNLLDNMHVPMEVFKEQWDTMLDKKNRIGQLGDFAGFGFGLDEADGIKQPFLGVQIDRDAELEEGGLLVNAVVKESAAERAGFEEGDIILEFNGEEPEDFDELVAEIKKLKIDEEAEVLIRRDGKEKELTVIMGSRTVPDPVKAKQMKEFREHLQKEWQGAQGRLKEDDLKELVEDYLESGKKIPLKGDAEQIVAQLYSSKGGKWTKENEATMQALAPTIKTARKSVLRFVDGNSTTDKTIIHAVAVSKNQVLTKHSTIRKALQYADVDPLLVNHDDKELGFKIEEIDRKYDLALINVETNDLVPAAWVKSSDSLFSTILSAAGTTNALPLSMGVGSVEERSLTGENDALLGIGVVSAKPSGLKVKRVDPDSAANLVGITNGDVITQIDDKKVNTYAELMGVISSSSPGDIVELTVYRLDIRFKKTVRLGSRKKFKVDIFPQMDGTAQMSDGLSLYRSGYPNALETDLTLTPAECGTPLVDLDGNIVGFNIARSSRTRCYTLPTADILKVLNEFGLNVKPAKATKLAAAVRAPKPKKPKEPEPAAAQPKDTPEETAAAKAKAKKAKHLAELRAKVKAAEADFDKAESTLEAARKSLKDAEGK